LKAENFNASEFCSRKLWQLVNSEPPGEAEAEELERAVVELMTRRHYLEELARIGKLGGKSHSA